MFWSVIFISIFCVLLYVYFAWNRKYWKNRGVVGPEPRIVLGTFPGTLTQKINQVVEIDELYRNYKNKSPFVGVYSGRDPQLLIIDSCMVKDILIKDFKNFEDNQISSLLNKEADPLFGRNPLMLTGREWRQKRAEIAPAFTMSRMRAMYPIVDDVCIRFTEFVKKGPRNLNGFEAKELSAKFTTEVVSNCIYGIDSESFTADKSVMLTMGSNVLDTSTSMMIYFILTIFFPIVKRFWKKAFIPKKIENFFVKLTMDAIKMRNEMKSKREDFMGYVLYLRNKRNISDMDVAAHAISFFLDGVETSSVALSFTLYYLGKNKHIQEKLRKEVAANIGSDGRISFEKFTEMKYLEQVMNEGLRLAPPAGYTTRICKNTTSLADYKDRKLTVEKGTVLLIPYYSIHHDPDIYENPDEFKPERFDDSVGGIKKYKDNCTFLAFGTGPRMCLGVRFAYLQTKAALAEVIRNFEISVNPMTKEPLVFDPTNLLLTNTGGIWLDFKCLTK